MFKKYGVGNDTLVICAPNGDKLAVFAGDQCTQSNVMKSLKTFKEQFLAWQKQAEAKKKS